MKNSFAIPQFNYLKQAEGSMESPVYVEGLIALYEKRYDDALIKAKEAYAKSNWSYEAKTLEGKALSGLGQNKSDAGDYKGSSSNTYSQEKLICKQPISEEAGQIFI